MFPLTCLYNQYICNRIFENRKNKRNERTIRMNANQYIYNMWYTHSTYNCKSVHLFKIYYDSHNISLYIHCMRLHEHFKWFKDSTNLNIWFCIVSMVFYWNIRLNVSKNLYTIHKYLWQNKMKFYIWKSYLLQDMYL